MGVSNLLVEGGQKFFLYFLRKENLMIFLFLEAIFLLVEKVLMQQNLS